MKKVLIVGSRGQLGFDLARVFSDSYKVDSGDRPNLDVENQKSCMKLIQKLKPDIVLNTAAFHKTIECEGNPEKSFSTNALGAYNVALASKSVGAICVYFSTDYVFDGSKKNFSENDFTHPLNVYGASKLAGEMLTAIASNKSYVIRTSWLFGIHQGSKGPNFVENMLKRAPENEEVSVVSDQVGSPTYTLDLAQKVKEVVESGYPFGVYHITNSGYCSWYEFAKEIFKQSKVEKKVVSTKTKDDILVRPKYSVLKNSKLRRLGSNKMRSWQKALEDYLKNKNGQVL